MGIPALCERCGEWFTHPGMAMGTSMTYKAQEGARINHPGCGGDGVIPAGEYEFTEAGVKAVLDANLSTDDLAQLIALLREAHGAATYEELADVVDRAPRAVRGKLKKLLPTDLSKATFYLTILMLALNQHSQSEQAGTAHRDAQAQVAAIERSSKILEGGIPQLVLDAIQQAKGSPVGQSPPASPKVGRNDPCSCGSGKKYKMCCGR
jgi:hypothetical protein